MKILMLSGITGTGKSTIFNYLSELGNETGFATNIFISSYHCQNSFKGTDNEGEKLYQFYNNIKEFCRIERNREIGVVLENSVLNFCLEFDVCSEKRKQFNKLFDKSECKNVLLTIPKEKILERSILLTRKYRKPSWSRYLKDFNMTDNELSKMFEEKQDRLINYSSNFDYPLLTINTENMDWNKYTEEIVDFWRE